MSESVSASNGGRSGSLPSSVELNELLLAVSARLEAVLAADDGGDVSVRTEPRAAAPHLDTTVVTFRAARSSPPAVPDPAPPPVPELDVDDLVDAAPAAPASDDRPSIDRRLGRARERLVQRRGERTRAVDPERRRERRARRIERLSEHGRRVLVGLGLVLVSAVLSVLLV